MNPLTVPLFNRVDDYLGPWCMESDRFAAMWRLIEGTNMAAHLAAGPSPKPASQMQTVPSKAGKSTAIIPVQGTLMMAASSMGGTSTVQLRRDVRAAAADPTVSAILLDIYSPGGAVAGTYDLAADIKAATRKKPVWAHVNELGASAAYWLASQADAIYANSPTAMIGSIGTVLTVYDVSQAAERDGIKAMVFRTGPLKGVGAPGDAITEEQAAYFQRMVNETQTHFDEAVRKGRGLSAAQLAAVRTGGVFSAAEALDKKLIDGIRSLDATLAALSSAK